jgi:glycosyltransferase involved in cell wall biosynthesis
MSNSKSKDTKKWFTCAPLHFQGNARFFARDSGLLCKGFQEIGVPCKAILPGPPKEDDQTEDLIRTDYKNLEDPDWWRSLGGTGVVFYGWGDGRYLKIVRAMKGAGLILITNLDTGGLFCMANGVRAYTGSLWRGMIGLNGITPYGIGHFMWRVLYSLTLRKLRVDRPRAVHLGTADIIGSISPLAVARVKRFCKVYGGDALAAKVHHIPHANASYMKYDPAVTKERLIVAVGRWDDEKIKGTDLLLEVIALLLREDPEIEFEIYGTITVKMETFRGKLGPATATRFKLVGNVPNAQLRLALQRARVSLCTSLAEGYHTVSAEALCSGCSVVGPDVPEIPSMQWFTDGPFGTIAPRTSRDLCDAVHTEMRAWDGSERAPAAISNHWTQLLHAPRVAERIIRLAEGLNQSGRSLS